MKGNNFGLKPAKNLSLYFCVLANLGNLYSAILRTPKFQSACVESAFVSYDVDVIMFP